LQVLPVDAPFLPVEVLQLELLVLHPYLLNRLFKDCP
jgi:hypothetical protein